LPTNKTVSHIDVN